MERNNSIAIRPCFDYLSRGRSGDSSVIGYHLPQSVSVFVGELFRRSADQLVVAQPGANARRWERIVWRFHNTGNDVLQEHVRYGDLRLYERLKCCPCFARFVSVAAMRASNCVTDSVSSPLRISRSQAARINACSDRKPRSFDAFRTCSLKSSFGNNRLRSILGFAIYFLPFRRSKSGETWKNLRWHICATFGAKAATSLPSEK
jgi:hypothetical protein